MGGTSFVHPSMRSFVHPCPEPVSLWSRSTHRILLRRYTCVRDSPESRLGWLVHVDMLLSLSNANAKFNATSDPARILALRSCPAISIPCTITDTLPSLLCFYFLIWVKAIHGGRLCCLCSCCLRVQSRPLMVVILPAHLRSPVIDGRTPYLPVVFLTSFLVHFFSFILFIRRPFSCHCII
jgi:hypothetical protein